MKRLIHWGSLIWLLVAMSPAALAHPLAPALLELRQLAHEEPIRYEVLWRRSAMSAPGNAVEPRLPSSCQALTPVKQAMDNNQSLSLRWQVQCGPGGLQGHSIGISGLSDSPINVILRLVTTEGKVSTTLLDSERPSYTVPEPGAMPPVFRTYLGLGVEHLLSGLDHVLFLIGLLLLVRKLRPLVITVTAFTLGHSITLALATLELIQVNPDVTELAIALSILVLALEVVRPRPQSFMRRWPWLMAGGFGLLHGLGFAGALAKVGLPHGEIPLALFAFNVGIEVGQLLVVALVLALSRLWGVLIGQRLPASAKTAQFLFLPYLIGTLAAYWCIERAVSVFA